MCYPHGQFLSVPWLTLAHAHLWVCCTCCSICLEKTPWSCHMSAQHSLLLSLVINPAREIFLTSFWVTCSSEVTPQPRSFLYPSAFHTVPQAPFVATHPTPSTWWVSTKNASVGQMKERMRLNSHPVEEAVYPSQRIQGGYAFKNGIFGFFLKLKTDPLRKYQP